MENPCVASSILALGKEKTSERRFFLIPHYPPHVCAPTNIDEEQMR